MNNVDEPTLSDEVGALRSTLASTISGSDESVALRVLETALWAPQDWRERSWILVKLTRNEVKQLATMACFLVNPTLLKTIWKAAVDELARQRAVRERSITGRLREPRPVLRLLTSKDDAPPS